MQVVNKELKDTDVRVRLSFPTHSLRHLDFRKDNFADLNVKDSSGELRTIRCLKRELGPYEKPVLSRGWRQFVEDYGLRVGDKVVLLLEDDPIIGSQYKIEAKRRFLLLGQEVWFDVPKAR